MAELSTLDDRALWNRATAARCDDAFETLMRRHEDLVWSVCSRLLRHANDAEDAFQMAFVATLEHGGEINSIDFRPWLYRVAYRAALRVQSGRLDVDTLNDANSVAEASVDTDVFRSIEQAEQSQLIDEALDSLPEKYREVLVLHYCCGVARNEIATQLQLTPQTVKARLSRARKALRSRLLRRGLSLAAAAALLGSRATAALSDSLRTTTLQVAQQWLAGAPVGLDLAQFSDFPQTEYGMNPLRGLNAKWTLVGAAALLALFLVFEAGKATGASTTRGVSDGVGQLAAEETRITGDGKAAEILQAAHFVAKPANEPVEPIAQNAEPVRTNQTPVSVATAQPMSPNTYARIPNTQMVSASQVQQAARGLPEGNWKRETAIGSISFLVEGNRLQVDFEGKGQFAPIHGSLLGEYSVASDGTVYGLFHGVDVEVPPAMQVAAGELSTMVGLVSDSPFAMRVHTTGNTMVVKKFNFGVGVPFPSMAGMDEYAAMCAQVGYYVMGAYRVDNRTDRVGQLRPRATYQTPAPQRMAQPTHRNGQLQWNPATSPGQPTYQPVGGYGGYPYPNLSPQFVPGAQPPGASPFPTVPLSSPANLPSTQVPAKVSPARALGKPAA